MDLCRDAHLFEKIGAALWVFDEFRFRRGSIPFRG